MATTPADLQEALQSGATDIEVRGELTGMPMVTLPPGVRLRGGTLWFGAKGVRLTRDNVLEDVTVVTEPDEATTKSRAPNSSCGIPRIRADVRPRPSNGANPTEQTASVSCAIRQLCKHKCERDQIPSCERIAALTTVSVIFWTG